MNPYAPHARRAQRRHRTEVALVLDGGVDFLMEDDWRSPWSDHPLRPRRRKPYPRGTQVRAQMTGENLAERVGCSAFLLDFQVLTASRVVKQRRDHALITERRLRAAESPLAVIEPKSSVPGVQRVIAELERRTHLPIEEIRATFRQGRRSLEQLATRNVVEDAIIATYRHHRMVHPVFEDPEKYGRQQWLDAREVWREFSGQSLVAQRDRQLAFETFGEYENDWDEVHPVEYSLEPEADSHGNRVGRRAPRSQRKPQIVPRLAEALRVYPQRVREILAKSGTPTDKRVGHDLSLQEAS